MTEPVHRRARRRLGDPPAGFETGTEPGDAQWLAALRDEDAGPEAWELGVTSASSAQVAVDLAALAERVAALEDCLVWEVAAGQTARREVAELRARLDEIAVEVAAVEVAAAEAAAPPARPLPVPAVEPATGSAGDDDRRLARRDVVEGLRASMRAAGRLLDGRRAPGPR